MRSKVRFRIAFLAPLVGALLALVAVSAPAAQASVEIEKFVAVNCTEGNEACAEEPVGAGGAFGPLTQPKIPTLKESEETGYRQAGGHVPYGVTDFQVKTVGDYAKGEAIPTGIVTHVRTDVAAGLATSPAAVPLCSQAEFGEKEAVPGTGFYAEPTCKAETLIGKEKATVYAGSTAGDVPLEGSTYNLVQPVGRSAEYGSALKLPIPLTYTVLHEALKGSDPAVETAQYYAHTLIEGSVEWGVEAKGTGAADYHDYFEVVVSPNLPLIRSRLVTYGTAGNGAFITNATKCPGNNTTILSLEGAAKEVAKGSYTTLLGLDGCENVPFGPTFTLTPETKQQDMPDGITTELKVPHFTGAKEVDSAQLNTASIVLPEGLTINPSAAHSVTEACTVAQVRIGSPEFGTSCPAGSKLGTVSLEVPTLPEALTGNIYLGGEGTGSSITKPPYTIYLDAQTTRYGVDVRLKGTVTPNATTGRLTTTFTKNPEQPFTNLKLAFNTGTTAPLANSLTCGTATTETSLSPFTGTAAQSPSSVFTVDSNNAGGACASPPPFSLTQSTVNQAPGNAGAATSYTLNIARADGQQYLSKIQTTLPAGLVGLIPTVTQCGEAQANAGTCPDTSKIGVVGVTAGAGPTPYAFSGSVYLTGPYGGAPFGLSVVVPAVAGPFNLGNVVTRGTLTVNEYTARVTATSTLPTIVGGIPLRLKSLSVNINKQGFLINPTNCGTLSTDSTLTGFSALGSPATATQSLSTPFQVGACGALAFKPSFKAKTSAKTSKANGASLETTLNIGTGQTNYKSVMVQLPRQLPSRLTTLQKACPEAVFASNPYHCPSGSFVGGARANTPTLPGKLQGPAILVSHAGLAFPDLDLVMEANGVRVIVVGNTKISKGITTTTFASTPDVPVSSITVNLPIGGHSALTANGNLCAHPLTMPTTLIGQNGFKVTQKTKITVAKCGVRIVGRKVVGNTAYITVQTYSPGRISGSGSNLKTVYRHLKKAEKKATLKVRLSKAGLRKGKPLKVKLRVGFVPKKKSNGHSAATTKVTFR
ncbi:MAG: hypothetical protein ACRDK7_07570 [Solirubrobacteraceae bacterium]